MGKLGARIRRHGEVRVPEDANLIGRPRITHAREHGVESEESWDRHLGVAIPPTEVHWWPNKLRGVFLSLYLSHIVLLLLLLLLNPSPTPSGDPRPGTGHGRCGGRGGAGGG
eukprot:4726733-Pyramimonas_sp.AAC.1